MNDLKIGALLKSKVNSKPLVANINYEVTRVTNHSFTIAFFDSVSMKYKEKEFDIVELDSTFKIMENVKND